MGHAAKRGPPEPGEEPAMTIQTPHATTFAIPRRSQAEPPPSILMWMVEALVLGPDRNPPPEEDTPCERPHSPRAAAPRRAPLPAAIPGMAQ
jgi:hypothetical protein